MRSLSTESREAVKTIATMAAIIHAGNIAATGPELVKHGHGEKCGCIQEARDMFNATIEQLQGELE